MKYKALFEGAGVAIWDCDFSEVHRVLEEVRQVTPDVRAYMAKHPDLVRRCIAGIRVRDVNEHAVVLYRARSKDELKSRLGELFPPEAERVFAEEFLSLYEGKPHFQDRKFVRALDGERLCVLATVTAAPSERPLGNVIVTVVDVTAHERARQELKESEAKFRDIFELNAVPMILWDDQGQILQVNQAFLDLSGYTRDAVESRLCCEMLLTEADWPAVAQAKVKALQYGKFDPFEKDLIARDGTRIPVLMSGGSLAGRSDRGVTFLVDLREQKRAAEAARKEALFGSLMRDIALAANAASEPEEVLGHCLGMLCRELNFALGHVLLVRDEKIISGGIWYCADNDRQAFAGFVAASAAMGSEGPCVMAETIHAGVPVWLRPVESQDCLRAKAATKCGIATLIVLPLHAQGEPVAALEFGSCEPLVYNEDLARNLVAFGTELSRVFERQRAAAALQRSELTVRKSGEQLRGYAERLFILARRLVRAHEEERTRIARELHDDFNQRIAAACIAISNLLNDPQMKRTEVRKQLIGVKEAITELSNDVRNMSHSLHPVVLEHIGVGGALRAQCEEFSRLNKLPVEFLCRGEQLLHVLDSETSICLYRVLQEALANVRKHSNARKVRVTVLASGHWVELRIHDDGKLFDPIQARNKGLGLTNMEERVRLLGGTFYVASRAGKGNKVSAAIPIDKNRFEIVRQAVTDPLGSKAGYTGYTEIHSNSRAASSPTARRRKKAGR